jgi:GNAT superfamily N-acetyltransferase
MSIAVRPYHPSDLYSLYQICLKTADSGQDGSHLYRDPELIGAIFAAPYAVAEPDLCLIVTVDEVPSGYILGTRDSAAFGAWVELNWFSHLRRRYPLPAEGDDSFDAAAIRSIHEGYSPEPQLASYPAHLHIDLLPAAQGQGWGRRLIEQFLARLRELGVRGVHLGVGKANSGAVQFYSRVGFQRVLEADTWIGYGRFL